MRGSNTSVRWQRPGWLTSGASLFCLAGIVSSFGAVAGAPDAAESSTKIFQWRPFLAPFHAVVLHYPIGFLTMAFILELYGWRRQNEVLRRVTRLVIVLSLVSGLMAASLGILRAGGGGYEARNLEMHRWFGMAVPVFTVATLLLHNAASRSAKAAWGLGYRGMLMATLALLVVAGHYGGNLTHGSDYLVRNAPEFVKALIEEKPPVEALAQAVEGERDANQRFYLEKIKPVLDAKCVRCHGKEKQKGDYRLDQREFALKAGESGKVAIKPGNPLESNLIRVILLPHDFDEVMPPEGKEPLKPEEILLITHWVQHGAAYAEPAAAPKVAAQSEGKSPPASQAVP